MSLKNTQTEKNILAAFSGESQARTKYVLFAQAARAEGNEKTAILFEKMAENEKHHAKLWLNTLQEIGTSAENLKSAIGTEHFEWTQMYKSYAQTAREEGLEDIATLFERVAVVERDHEKMFKKELIRISDPAYKPEKVQAPTVQKPVVPPPKPPEKVDVKAAPPPAEEAKTSKQKWRCPICGLVVEADEAPYLCELCGALGVWDMVK